MDDALRRDPGALLDHLGRVGVHRLFLPFVALQQLAEAARGRDALPAELTEVVTAGEQLQVGATLADLFRRTGARLVNQYGPTECHVVTAHPLEGPPEGWPELPPIGRPIANARAVVLDEQLRPVPVGVPGELCLGGAAVARGYLGDEALTAARFVDDPQVPGGRLYRTGDLARHLDDGSLQFLGRRDDQVKLRGFRVELGEVETVLLDEAAVAAAAAVVREDVPGDQRLVAYVVPADGAAAAGADGADAAARDALVDGLRAALAARLPGYMLPQAYVVLDALPLTPSGKLDRRALPAPDARQARGAFVAPRDETETQLAALWVEVLGVDRVGVEDDFFQLGGHSLLAMRVASRVRDLFGVEVTLQRLFDETTVAALAAHVDALRAAGVGAAAGDDDEVIEI